jgi:F-type H+-transporting ATPase subunit a
MEQLWFTHLLNQFFANPVTAFLRMFHIEPKHADAPISNSFAMEMIVFVALVAIFFLIRSRLSVDNPGGVQHLAEFFHGFVNDQAHEIIGHGSEHFVAFLTTLGVFILACNLLGVIPSFESPTGVPVVPLGCAICAFVYYNWQGIKHHGAFNYFKHFFGPPMEGMSIVMRIPLAILMFPIEIVSHVARLLSLTVRLWANIFAGDLVTLVFFSMIPIGIPVVFIALHIGVAFLQAYVFTLLTIIYLSGAVAEEH